MTTADEPDAIDWTAFDEYPPSEVRCRCDRVFASHAKYILARGGIVSRKPCPSCGATTGHRSAGTNCESFSYDASDVGVVVPGDGEKT